ncbi:MAG: leucyl aminopeptidase [bacterium]|nr:leucyl aminopeptidase [bacterium]
MKIDVFCGDPFSQTADILVLPVWKGGKHLKLPIKNEQKEFASNITLRLERKGFDGKLGESHLFPVSVDGTDEWMILGVGEKKGVDADRFRQFGAHLVRSANLAKAKSVVLPMSALQETTLKQKDVVQAIAEGMQFASYRFHAYHGTQTKTEPKEGTIERVTFVVARDRDLKRVTEAIGIAETLASAVHLTRDLVNTPPADMAPKHLASVAKGLADKASGIQCTVLTADDMKRLGMGATLAVAQGSEHAPVGIHLTYTPKEKSKKTVAIVGKGVTFDSGGLSIKPAKSMETMKCDMAGAATVVGLFKALRNLQPNVTVHGIFLAVENMPGHSAFRPGDVVTAMDGSTIEVLNTDAEGRLTLADALVYATEQKPDYIIDLATLTGACIVALGDDIAALLSNNSRLASKMCDASEETGEAIWELPLHAPYQSMMKSKIADLKNISSGHGAGTITAALFLQPFVKKIPWIHLDIAGPSFNERPSRPDVSYGGTGFGVRLLANFLQKL